MTDETDLLPLPKWMSNYTIPADSSVYDEDVMLADRMRDYARANVARAVAPLQDEVEALRAEVAEWKRVAAAQAELHGEAEERAERLAVALREWCSCSSISAVAADQFRRSCWRPQNGMSSSRKSSAGAGWRCCVRRSPSPRPPSICISSAMMSV